MKATFNILMNRASVHNTKKRLWDYVSKVSGKILAHARRHSHFHEVMRDTALLELYEMTKDKTEK